MRKKRLLLHVCCAPCSTHVIESLRDTFDITCYFYNPNIWPLREYRLRLEEARRFCRRARTPIIIGSYDSAPWNLAVRGLECEPEGGKRCGACYEFRLKDTAGTASMLRCDLCATTLTVSPHKNAETVNEAGRRAAAEAGVVFHEADFKKRGGFIKSLELSRRHALYRQRYCGCRHSLGNR